MKRELTVVLFGLFTSGMFVVVQGTIEVSVMERDSVTLKSGVSSIKTYDEIEWKFKNNKIATISRDSSGISAWVTPDESFRDRLQLDNQTGDLKISNIRITDFGLYKLDISSTDGSSEVEFTVNVLTADRFNTKSVRKEDLLTLLTGLTDKQKMRDDVIQWRFGEQKSLIAEINRTAGIFSTYDGPDGRFRDRLQLDNQTGSLTITNTRTEHAGLYEVEITSTSSRYTTHHTESFPVTIRVPDPRPDPSPNPVPDPGLSLGEKAGIVVGVLVAAVAAVAVGIFFYRNKSRQNRQREENGGNNIYQSTEEEIKLSNDP